MRRHTLLPLLALLPTLMLFAPTPAAAETLLNSTLPRITACGTQLCTLDATGVTHSFTLRIATIYPPLANPQESVNLAIAAGANTVRITDYFPENLSPKHLIPGDPKSEPTWRAIDNLIALAASQGIYTYLDLTAYRNQLQLFGVNPYTADASHYLYAVTHRINTATGLLYGEDTSINVIALAGEPSIQEPRARVIRYYMHNLHLLAEFAPSTLRTAGGLLNTTWREGVPSRIIHALPDETICALHIYTPRDITQAIPLVASECLGKPWIIEETGKPQRLGDTNRRDWFTRVTWAALGNHAAGIGVWNVGLEKRPTSHDVNPGTPLAWQAIREGYVRVEAGNQGAFNSG